jgi:putative DNA-invertase from lambdoid prophage Rac
MTGRVEGGQEVSMRAVIYCRVSTNEQGLGLEAQERECRLMVERMSGVSEVLVFSDRVSGSVAPLERSGFMQALDVLCDGDVLLVYRRDRLGRTALDNALTERLIDAVGARLVSSDVADDQSAEASLMKAMLDSIAEYERSIIKKRTRQAMEVKRQRGEAVGFAPLGFQVIDGMLEVNQEEVSMIERVREKRMTGVKLADLVDWCEVEGIRTRNGNTPSLRTICHWCRGLKVEVERKYTRPTKHRRTIEGAVVGLAGTCQDLREKGLSVRQIAVELEARGFTNSKGKPIPFQQVAVILSRHKD